MWDEASNVIDATGLVVMRQGRLDVLSGWINQLPEATRLGHPRLAYLMGLCALQKGDPADAVYWLDEALEQAQASGNQRIQGAALAALGSVNFVQLQFERTLELASQALTYPVSPYVRVQALMARASVALFGGEWDQAAADLDEALDIVQTSGDKEALLALMLFLGQEFTLLPGGRQSARERQSARGLGRIESFCTGIQVELDGKGGSRTAPTADRPFGSAQDRPVRLGLEDVMAFIHLRRGRIGEAIAAGERAITLKEQLGGYYPFLGLNAAITVATARTALGDYDATGRYLALAASAVSALPLNQHTVVNGLFPQARTYWLQGRVDKVKVVYDEMQALAQAGEESPQAEVLRIVVASMLDISRGAYETAVESLMRAEELAESAPLSSIYVCPLVMRAYALLHAGDVDSALQVFAPVLVSCEDEGTPGRILQEGQTAVALLELALQDDVHAAYAGELLARLEPEPAGEAGALREAPLQRNDFTPLTERELEVLQLIAGGASNKMIAEELVISMPTVKSHVSHILGKLDVSSRGQAVARGRELGLV